MDRRVFPSAVLLLCLYLPFLLPLVFANSEGDALNALKSKMADPNNFLQSWDPTLVSTCTWFHVTCNTDNSVTRVKKSAVCGPHLQTSAREEVD